jgi:hypothetical protein
MAEDWIDCGEFIKADVVRFSEAVWERRGPKARQKSYRVGNREVRAQVVDIYKDADGVWLVFEVIESKVIDDQTGGRLVHPLIVRKEYKRELSKLVKWSKPQRLLWSDEDNRAQRAAEFGGPTLRRRKAKE